MKKLFLISLILFFCFTIYSDEFQSKPSSPQLGILDIMSSSFNESEIKMFTDVLRTELYKLDYFSIVERGVILNYMDEVNISNKNLIDDTSILELGRVMNVDKLLVCSLNSYAETTVMNIRIIDVDTSFLDYTENVFLQDSNQIFDAIKDLVIKIELQFIEKNTIGDPVSYREKLLGTWKVLGASDEVADKLSNKKIDPTKYLEMRQYDISFSPDSYFEMIDSGIEDETIIKFFKEGISYSKIKRSVRFGILDLENFIVNFKRRGLNFDDYLDAYGRQILKAEDYIEYKKGFKKYQFFLGCGGVADSLPIMTSDFTFFILQLGAEYYITDYQRDFNKISTEMGLKMMNAIIPSPYFQMNAYIGKYPFYLKGSIGSYAEVFLGGHVGLYGKVGMEISSRFEFDFMVTFWGNQPEVSYSDFETKLGSDDYVNLEFPYFAASLLYKF